MIRDWLAKPHIGGWWGTGWVETALMDEDRDGGKVDMRIVWHAETNRPFAYVQDYNVRAWPAPQYADLAEGARALDMFLGDPAYLGKGHASAFVRLRAHQLLGAGAPLVAVDPAPENTRAVATYAKAGFEGTRITPCEDGDPVRIMLFKRRT
jgi:aminoglycoside 6'-N-acetyltransferase